MMSDHRGDGKRDAAAEPVDLASVPEESDTRSKIESALFEMRRVIVGQEQMLERVLVALLADGHLLIEGVPGLAKTLTVRTLADVLGGIFKRVQFTPDLVPADIVGTRMYQPRSGEFETELGPVFCNFLLADEINRAPAKVQSALLEVMQEQQVTIGKETYRVPTPFLVMATENPIESEGTYPLPEAQVDRFMMKVVVDYPGFADETTVVERSLRERSGVKQVLSPADLLEFQNEVADVYVDRLITEYAVGVATATRSPEKFGMEHLSGYIAYGASPRGSINLVRAARALASIRGRRYVVPTDVQDLAKDVLRHRLSLTYEALAEDVTPDAIVEEIVEKLPLPNVELAPEKSA
jgi:MoxR-like ATPase